MPKKSRRYITPDYNFIPDDIIPYTSIEVLRAVCSADDILDRMRYDNNILFKNLRYENFNVKEVLSTDSNCMCKMGWGIRPFVNRYYCIPCEFLRRLSSTVKVPENKMLKIEVGKYAGNDYQVNLFEGNYEEYTTREDCQYLYDTMIYQQTKLGLTDTTFVNFLTKTQMYTTSSPITNYIMACIFITNKMTKYKMPNIPDYVWSYQCEKTVKVVSRTTLTFNDIINNSSFQKKNTVATAHTNLNPLKDSIVKSILLQLVSSLHFLSKYAFIHGAPNISNLKFSLKNVNYKYEDVNITAPFTLHIQPTVNSSFSFESDNGNNIRLGCVKDDVNNPFITYPIKNREVIINYYKTDTIPGEEIPMLPEISDKLTYCYRIGNDNINIFSKLMTGYSIPLMDTSFEFYCFMISLMCEDSFYVSFMEDIQLQRIWYNLWLAPEYATLMEELHKLKLNIKVEQNDILNLLSKYTLRSDALKYFWDFLKLD
jgi:hypothetical protein